MSSNERPPRWGGVSRTRFLSIIAIAALAILSVPTAFAFPILVTPLAFDFGNVAVGETATNQSVTITNVSSMPQPVSLAGGGAGVFGGANGCTSMLAPGASCNIYYAFKPTALGSASGTTTLFVNGEANSISFQGSGVEPLAITPLAFNFGTVAVGATANNQSVTITNVSSVSQPISLAGGGAGAFGGANGCTSMLAPGASCSIYYAFKPTASGSTSGTTTLFVNGEAHSLSFTGTGITDRTDANPLLVTPLAFDFGNVAVGDTATNQYVTITNVSSVSQPISLAGGGAGVFGGANGCTSMLAPGASCNIYYAFKPTNLGSSSGTSTLFVNGEAYPLTFQGSGVDPFLISPLTFNFGEIDLGSTSPFQSVDILNVSNATQMLNLAGGGAGVFGGANGCTSMLAPDAFCSIYYAFTPTAVGPVTGTSTLVVNGRLVDLTFFGTGIGPETSPPEASVPEPSTFALMGIGLMLIGYHRNRRAI